MKANRCRLSGTLKLLAFLPVLVKVNSHNTSKDKYVETLVFSLSFYRSVLQKHL